MALVPWQLSHFQRASYSLGHILNDLCASMWFTYLLVYFHQVRNFNNKLAGLLMLVGQVADGVATPLVGLESDNTKGLGRLGPRKTWHLFGTIAVLVSFPFIFFPCINCDNTPDWAQMVYFVPFVVIFQVGWASVQINHLALSADLAEDENQRTHLISYRNIGTVLSSITVYGLTWLFLAMGKDSSSGNQLCHDDSDKFMHITLVVISLGFLCSVIFHAGTPSGQPPDPSVSVASDALKNGVEDGAESIERSLLQKHKMKWTCWFKEPQFYAMGVAYMCIRLFVNVSMVYISMYLEETLKMEKDAIAQIPLIILGGNVAATILLSIMSKYAPRVNRKVWLAVGVKLAAGTSIAFWFMDQQVYIYPVAVLQGLANGILLVTMSAMVGDFISCNKEGGGFVFGAFSLLDKVSNGVVVQIIQYFHPCLNCCPACSPYYRKVQSLVPGGAVVLLFISLLFLLPQKIGIRRVRPGLRVLGSPAQYGSLARGTEVNGGPVTIAGCGSPDQNGFYGGDYDDARSPLLRTSINTPPDDVDTSYAPLSKSPKDNVSYG